MNAWQRLSPLWFLAAQLAVLVLVALVAWLIHGAGEAPPDPGFDHPGSGPRLSVADVLDRSGDFPPGYVTVVGRLDAIVRLANDAPPALVLTPPGGNRGGELLVVPQDDAQVPRAILRAGEGATVRVIGGLRIATATHPPPGGDRLLAEVLGEPVLDAQRISLGAPSELRELSLRSR